ncbi:MAG: right-handed parallel beta-helix repeat-containing protein, partial [Thermoplasmata archaeon]|nr:right-handed parallel beta-helix repeat-containing protein [Thermoplasmata archaeon]
MSIVIAGFIIAEIKNGITSNVEAQPALTGGNTLYVGGSGLNNYTSIQDAIDNASDGDTIYVYSGIYYENVVINKRINLVGEDRNTTIIDGSGSGNVVEITADCVTISDFTVQNSGSNWSDAGIKLHGVQHCRIEYVTASNNYNGIYLWHSNNCSITNTNAGGNSVGILLEDSTNCSIRHSTASNDLAGIGLGYSTNCSITNTNASNNDYGIWLSSSTKCSIIKCTLSNNNYDGILLYFSTNCTITNTNASNNWEGIYLDSSTNCSITNCTVSNNNDDGIHLWDSTNCIIHNNTMLDNGIMIYGYDIAHWNTHTIDTSNTVNGKPVYYWKNVNGGTVPSGAGQIILANCTNVMIENYTVNDATVGIEISFSSHCSIINTTTSNNRGGIWLAYSTTCTITNTNASNNWEGIYLDSSTNCSITNCTV